MNTKDGRMFFNPFDRRLIGQIKKMRAVYLSKKEFNKMYGEEYNPNYAYETKLGIKIYVE